jgi:radical SAM protein with 4Fe4S-binding SPASM domain
VNCVFTRRDNLSEVLAFFGGHQLLADIGVRAVRLRPGIDPDYREALGLQPVLSGGQVDSLDAFFEFLAGANGRFPYSLLSSLQSSVFLHLLHRRTGFAPTRATAHGMFYPGAARLYVDAGGGFYVCQLLDVADGKIGDVERGFDYDRIRSLLRFFVEFCQISCEECCAQRLCGFCVSHRLTRAVE